MTTPKRPDRNELSDSELLNEVRLLARRYGGMEIDAPIDNEWTLDLVRGMREASRRWERVRDTFRRLDDGGQS